MKNTGQIYSQWLCLSYMMFTQPRIVFRLTKDIQIKPDAVVDERVLTYAETILAKSTKNQAGLYCPAFFLKSQKKICRKKLFVYIKICPTIVIHNNDNRLS
jgi:hypothetical protein